MISQHWIRYFVTHRKETGVRVIKKHKAKKIWICFRRTGRVRFIFVTNRPQGSIFFFSQVFRLRSVRLLTSRTIFGYLFSSINNIDVNQVDFCIHKGLGCQIWVSPKKQRYFFRIIQFRTSCFPQKNIFCGRPGELIFRHPVRWKQTYYFFGLNAWNSGKVPDS